MNTVSIGTFRFRPLVAYEGRRPIAFGADALEHAGADGVFVAMVQAPVSLLGMYGITISDHPTPSYSLHLIREGRQ